MQESVLVCFSSVPDPAMGLHKSSWVNVGDSQIGTGFKGSDACIGYENVEAC